MSKSFTNADFNPSGMSSVDQIKAAADNLAETIIQFATPGTLRDKAILDTQSASMFAVKSLFS